jgi:prepilin peptidase CpaA
MKVMHALTLEELCALLTVVVVSGAMVTDLRSRRIPNVLTFTAFGAALALRIAFDGWLGLGLALAGALAAPAVLLFAHMGRGLGMGDIKLSIAVGALLGPKLAIASMLCGAVIGGVIALGLLMRRGHILSDFFGLFLNGLPFLKRKSVEPGASAPASLTMPYGVAIGVGSLITLAVYTWLGISLL